MSSLAKGSSIPRSFFSFCHITPPKVRGYLKVWTLGSDCNIYI
jgi:hypothetical protein